MRPSTLGIIGLGAIGGSVARQAKQAGIATVLGWSPDQAERTAAVQQRAVDDAPAESAAVARAADLLILAAPPAANLHLLETLSPLVRRDGLITDVGSVKRGIVARAEALGVAVRFAGSHPLAGTHEHGFEASRGNLFTGAVVYVTPARGGDGAATAVRHFWETVLGARAVVVDATTHDIQMAVTSHLPQVIASLLGRYLAEHTPPGTTLGPGAKDTTRLAASEPGLWTEILLMNRDVLLPALRSLEEPLGELERALENGDAPTVSAWLARASEWRRRIGP